MKDPKNSAEKICDMLFFRGLVEFLNIMMQYYKGFLETKEEEKQVVNELIEIFDNSIESPEVFFSLNLNKKYEGGTKNMIKQKVKKFINDYIKGKINVFIHRAKRGND